MPVAPWACHATPRSEGIKCDVVGGIHRDQLHLQVDGELGPGKSGIRQCALHLLEVGVAPRGAIEIEQRPNGWARSPDTAYR